VLNFEKRKLNSNNTYCIGDHLFCPVSIKLLRLYFNQRFSIMMCYMSFFQSAQCKLTTL